MLPFTLWGGSLLLVSPDVTTWVMDKKYPDTLSIPLLELVGMTPRPSGWHARGIGVVGTVCPEEILRTLCYISQASLALGKGLDDAVLKARGRVRKEYLSPILGPTPDQLRKLLHECATLREQGQNPWSARVTGLRLLVDMMHRSPRDQVLARTVAEDAVVRWREAWLEKWDRLPALRRASRAYHKHCGFEGHDVDQKYRDAWSSTVFGDIVASLTALGSGRDDAVWASIGPLYIGRSFTRHPQLHCTFVSAVGELFEAARQVDIFARTKFRSRALVRLGIAPADSVAEGWENRWWVEKTLRFPETLQGSEVAKNSTPAEAWYFRRVLQEVCVRHTLTRKDPELAAELDAIELSNGVIPSESTL